MRFWGFFLLLAGLMPLAAKPEPGPAAQGGLVLEADPASADGLLQAFTKGSITDAELQRLEALPATRAMIQKTHQFNPDATSERFESTLRAVIARQALKPEQDPFAFSRLARHLADIDTLLKAIDQRGGQFGQDVYQRLMSYVPGGLDMHITVHFTLGGTSDGWAVGDKDFYLALDYFGSDYQGLVVLTSHEVYHLVQGHLMPETESKATEITRRNVDNLLIQTYMEGTATVVGDPTQVQDGGTWIKWFTGKYASNQDHIADDFGLFNTMLYRAAHDPSVDYDRLYSLGFSGGLGSAVYFVGYDIAQAIMEYQGRAALAGYLRKPARDFFVTYLDLCKQHKSDPRCLPVDPEIERLIRSP